MSYVLIGGDVVSRAVAIEAIADDPRETP